MNSHLDRFIEAQTYSYQQALSEIKSGYKKSHWMWYIFPQICHLGYSSTSVYYAIQSMDEAKAYLQHNILRTHLLEISEALLLQKEKSAAEIFGGVDAMKLHSCMTLFHLAEPECTVFKDVLNQYFQGNLDHKTLNILKEMEETQ